MKDSIKERVRLSDVLEAMGVVVKGKTCLCPLHPDRTPSMAVYENSWYCFVCAKGGDVIQLVMDVRGLSFRDALIWINETFVLGLTDEKPKRNYYLEALNENYKNLKQDLLLQHAKLCQRYYGLMESFKTQFWEWTADDYTFIETYHDRLDAVETQLKELDNARIELRSKATPTVTKCGRGF